MDLLFFVVDYRLAGRQWAGTGGASLFLCESCVYTPIVSTQTQEKVITFFIANGYVGVSAVKLPHAGQRSPPIIYCTIFINTFLTTITMLPSCY